jgi:hypothetical protein
MPNDHLPEAVEKEIRPQKIIRLLFGCLKYKQDLDWNQLDEKDIWPACKI